MIYLNNFVALSCLGATDEESADSLQLNHSRYLMQNSEYLLNNESSVLGKLTFIGDTTENESCRNILFIDQCLKTLEPVILNIIEQFGAARVGVVLGTSTSAISDVENKAQNNYRMDLKLPFDKRVYEVGCLSKYIKKKYRLTAPCYTIATACSSSGRALISACQLLESNLCDAVIVGGSDSLSKITVNGFDSLGALSREHCIPFHKNRKGINIGEGICLAIASKTQLSENAVKLIGYGSSSDAYHISAPEPSGKMAIEAMQKAIKMAGIHPQDIGYANLHGTGTVLNDSMEANAICAVFGNKIPVSSTKHLTGHTLGAASIVEAYICYLILRDNLALPYHNYKESDYRDEFDSIDLVTEPGRKIDKKIIISNSFAFGGNNISLIFKL